ncbi:hypothetical protein D3C72_2049520 [compost metagenome]
MGQVHVACAGAIEGQGKAIGKAVIEAFRADVRPPFELQHAGDAVFKLGKFIDQLGMLGRCDVLKKITQDDMAQRDRTGHGGNSPMGLPSG